MSNKILFGLSATAAILLSACGDEITEVTEVNEVGMKVIEKGEALPTCSSDNEGAMIYAVDSAAAYFCVNRKWTSMKGEKGDQGEPGKDGKDGENGKDGADGKDGKDGEKGDTGVQGKQGEKGDTGEAGTSCAVEQLPDSSGFKVLCGGDSVGVVLNGVAGEKGDKGDQGEQGPKGDQGNPGEKGDKGDKGEDGKSVEGAENILIDARDKQIYKIVTIGNQTWMAENLNYAYLQPTATLDSSSWCYDDDPANCEKYGRYYLWSAAMDSAAVFSDDAKGCGYGTTCTIKTPSRGICPAGWHIPSRDEWNTLYSAMDKSPYAMQAKGFENWPDATDAYGFSVLPAGKYYISSFRGMGSIAVFWSATGANSYANRWYIDAGTSNFYSETMDDGYSVRCVKD